ncbi:hypothetical protein CALK_1431 [Chitinivibrio alkaliphilus ACht1]|uniref:Uncharacterized protein n=1 Tax=Chitinivibrio alkaliphilus ACht1 TaxID=1313304 RepID=U7D6K4_9BACT|nr:hypothetical protein CALK_1431 [Chitinivibrio alkaliphilus ACht1]
MNIFSILLVTLFFLFLIRDISQGFDRKKRRLRRQ